MWCRLTASCNIRQIASNDTYFQPWPEPLACENKIHDPFSFTSMSPVLAMNSSQVLHVSERGYRNEILNSVLKITRYVSYDNLFASSGYLAWNFHTVSWCSIQQVDRPFFTWRDCNAISLLSMRKYVLELCVSSRVIKPLD